jgi:NAD(P)H-flavin reductase
MQGVKHASDMIWRERYDAWARLPDTQVLLAADRADTPWPGHVGLVTELLDEARFDPDHTAAMVCGPEPMMHAAVARLRELAVPAEAIWLSLERNMHCGAGHCGHCQLGPWFVCADGPVMRYADIGVLFGKEGF